MSAPRTDSANLLLTINAVQAGNSIKELNQKAADLRRKLEKLPIDSAEWKETADELQKINTALDHARKQTKSIASALDEVNEKTSFWGRTLEVAIGVFGGLSLENILQSLGNYALKLFDLGVAQDSMASKTRTVFGEAEKYVNDFAAKTATKLGLTRLEFVNLATGIGDLLVPMGFSQQEAAKLSSELVRMGGVLSEWSNGKFSTAEATEVLQKALLGERDALNSLGIDIKQELVDAELRERGQDKLTGAAKRQAEALVTLQLITQQSAAANQRFEQTTNSLVRKKAEFLAKISAITEGFSSGLTPAFASLLSMGLGVLNFLIEFGRVLLGIPKFLYDNRVELAFLVVGLVTLNWNLIKVNAQLLLTNAGMALAAARTALMTAAQWSLNAAMSANPIGLIITAFSLLALGINEAYKRSETFRAVLAGLGAVATEVWNRIKAGFLLISGDTTGAAELFAKGKSLGKAFTDGYNESIQENRDKEELEERKAQERDRAAYEAEQNKGKERRKKTREEIEAEQKAAFEHAQKELERRNAQRELELEKRRQSEQLSEKTYQYALLEIKRLAALEELSMLRRHKGSTATETLKAEKDLLEITQQANDAHWALLNERNLSKEEQEIEDLKHLTNYKEQERQINLEADRQKVHDFSDAKREEYEIAEKWAAEQKKVSDEKRKHEEENEKKLQQQRRASLQAGIGVLGDFFSLQQEFLGKDEASRKKNADRIKRNQRAQVVVQGIAEVQKIWAGAAEFGPILGPIIGAAQSAIAIGRTVLAIKKINQQTFAGGGFTGEGLGFRDQTGHRPAGIVHQNEWVAPEWMTQHPVWGQYIGAFESVRRRGFADGGFTTSPTFSVLPPTQNDGVMMALVEENRQFRREISNWQRNFRVAVVYSDIEDAGSALASIQTAAAL